MINLFLKEPPIKLKKKSRRTTLVNHTTGSKRKKINVLYSIGTYHLLRVTSLLLERY
jgi:hypothetical protein